MTHSRARRQIFAHGGRSRRAVAVCLALLASSICGCEYLWKPNTAEQSENEKSVRTFEALYAQNCSGCHGVDGSLGPAPPLNDRLFMTIVPDDELLKVIRDGRPGTPMPAFARERGGTLTHEQVQALATGLKQRWQPLPPNARPAGLPPYAAAAQQTRSAPRRPLEPSHLKQTAERFSQACGNCHGEDGQGGSAGAIAVPAFLALISDQELRRIIITGRADLKMPSYASNEERDTGYRPLTSSEISDLVAYLRDLAKSTPSAPHLTAESDEPGRASRPQQAKH
jgi:cytochrome c oxidase cbb3-type subunit III